MHYGSIIGGEEDAKEFVKSFEPWTLFEGGVEALPIELEIRPM